MNVCGISSYQTNFKGLVPKGTSNVRKLCPNAAEAVKAAKNELKNIEKTIIDLENEIGIVDSLGADGYIRCLRSRLKAAKTLRANLLNLVENANDRSSDKSVKSYIDSYLRHIENIENRFDKDVSIISDMDKLGISAEYLEQYKEFYGL